MGKTMYLECNRGISGDMFVGALLDLGADIKILEAALKSLQTEGVHVQIGRVKKNGLDACNFDVVLDEKYENHDHDMEYLYGENKNIEEHEHIHEHIEEHEHVHTHRGVKEIFSILQKGQFSERAKELAEKIFLILAEAEGKAHGVSADKVHFHEIGALDSIMDVIAAAICMDNLDITKVVILQINEGQGQIRCQHGLISVPVPAVVNIVEAYGLPIHITKEQCELITPTGAAIAAAVQTDNKLPERFRIIKSGVGAGKREYLNPSMLRAFLIEELQECKC